MRSYLLVAGAILALTVVANAVIYRWRRQFQADIKAIHEQAPKFYEKGWVNDEDR